MGDADDIVFMCDLTASLIEPPGCHDGVDAWLFSATPAPPDPKPRG